MTKVLAGITTSVDGYVAGPHDGPGKGLGEGGERLHYWVFGGPWTYDAESKGEATGEDAAWLAEAFSRVGAVEALAGCSFSVERGRGPERRLRDRVRRTRRVRTEGCAGAVAPLPGQSLT